MVKRQTVWLSTMMVLSLMLIGYYTMNNDSGAPAVKQDSGTSVSTASSQPGAVTTGSIGSTPAQSSSGQGTDSSASQSGGNGQPQTSTDWYAETQTQLQQQLAQKQDDLTRVIDNNNATADQISQATQQLRQLENLQGQLDTAKEMIVAKGYKDCVILPNADGSKYVVYVKIDKLSADQAVQIMHLVSQQLNISAASVVVYPKA